MQYKVSELKGLLLDAAVEMAEGLMTEGGRGWSGLPGQCREYSSDPNDGSPIIEREGIATWKSGNEWRAKHPTPCGDGGFYDAEIGTIDARDDDGQGGTTQLEAAMRAYLISRLGETVELPEPRAN
jgi:hypothetical protein